jgi:type IV pilus assembly protein PilE
MEISFMKQTSEKRQSGFTMIEIMVVVVIVAILAAIAVPTYVKYVESARASEAKSVIGNIDNAAKMYYQTYGEWPTDVEELENSGQLEVDRSTKRKWVFELQLSDQGGRIIATSTGDMNGGEGRVVEFDRESGVYRGYGTAERES